MSRGLVVSVNTDDPALFGNSLAGEYRDLAELGVTRPEILGLVGNAIEASWADEDTKRRLSEGLAGFARA
jgi:aminodeoxyfutalosine deaminase